MKMKTIVIFRGEIMAYFWESIKGMRATINS